MANSIVQIVNAVKTKDWSTATEGIQQVLQQKLGERLAQERKNLGETAVKEGIGDTLRKIVRADPKPVYMPIPKDAYTNPGNRGEDATNGYDANEPLSEVGANKVHTAKFDRAVKDIKRKGHVDNPYAVAQAALGKSAIKAGHRH